MCQARDQGFTLLAGTMVEGTYMVTFWCKKFHRCTTPWVQGEQLVCSTCDEPLKKMGKADMQLASARASAAQLGIILPANYERTGATYTWLCIRGHSFEGSLAYMKRKHKEQGDEYMACIHCHLDLYYAENNLRKISQCAIINRTTMIKLECNICKTTFYSSAARARACPERDFHPSKK
jgi:hypothetical protein